jgi:hypothetical protein
MANYRVNWHLDRGVQSNREGDVIDMAPEAADALVKFGVLTPIQADSVDGQLTPAQLSKLTKDGLADYAKQRFQVDIDKSATKDAILAEIAEHETVRSSYGVGGPQ